MPISTRAHAIIDCVVAALLILVPGYALVTGAASDVTVPNEGMEASQGLTAAWTLVVAGVLVAGLILVTRYELAVFPAIPMSVHVAIDVLVGLMLIAAPWFLGFADVTWWPHTLMGVLILGVAVLTSPRSTRYDPELDTSPSARTE